MKFITKIREFSKHMTLSTKLIVAFIIIVLVVALQAVPTFLLTQETTQNIETFIDHSAPAINALNQMKAAEAAMVQEVFSFGLQKQLGILTGVSMINNQEIVRFQDNWRLMDEGFNSYQAIVGDTESPELISDLRLSSFDVYQRGLSYLTLNTQVDDVEILAIAHTELEAADDEYVANLQTALQNESIRLQELSEISTRNVRQSLLLNVVSSSVLIFAVIGIGFVIVHTIAQPIRKLETVARTIAQGDYSQRIDVNSLDEIGHLTITFNRMADAIQMRDKELSELNKALEQQVIETRLSRDQAESASQAKSTFLSNMSHELRTPLNMVIGYTSSMLTMPQMYNEEALPEVFREDVRLIQQSGQYLLGLINDILDLSKIEAGKLELQCRAVDLNETFKGVIASSLGLIGEKPIQVRPNYPDNLPIVWADPLRIRQILLNLMSNAIKFTSSGSVTLMAKVFNEKVHISVVDTGIGISADAMNSIFDRFQQVQQESDIQGTGLGLDISQQLAILHGSKVEIVSVVGQGSTFSFELPIASSEQLDLVTKPTFESATGTAEIFDDNDTSYEIHKTIILIEDDSGTRDMLHRILNMPDYTILDAHEGHLGIELVTQLLPDLVILDIQLPDIDGWQVLEQIRQQSSTQLIPVIVLTAYPNITASKDFDLLSTLEKPIEASVLLNHINTVFSNQQVSKEG